MACAPPIEAPAATALPVATRLITTPTAVPTATAVPAAPSPAASAAPQVYTLSDFDPYRNFYATERDGLFVTTRDPRGRYYYRWDDRRWYGLEDRVWFRTVDDLLTVFPSRVAAP